MDAQERPLKGVHLAVDALINQERRACDERVRQAEQAAREELQHKLDAALKRETLALELALAAREKLKAEYWECPDCAFEFHRQHTNADDELVCPLCVDIPAEREKALEEASAKCSIQAILKATGGPIDQESWNRGVVACRNAVNDLKDRP